LQRPWHTVGPVKKLVNSVLGRFDLQLVRSTTVLSHSLSSYFSLLKRLGFSPKHIIDVGANRGKWTKEAMRFFPHAHYTLVEPQDHLKLHVQDLIDAGTVTWICAGAADERGELPFAVLGRDDSSSFVRAPEAPERIRIVEVRTLNEIVSSSDAPFPELVKIDAEGFDLKVLTGASDLFGKTEIFLVEAMVCDNYDNTVLKVIQHMAAVGYQVMDITDLGRSPQNEILWVVEIAFVRVNSRLLDIRS
jgi:FkbM family methyltransferase